MTTTFKARSGRWTQGLVLLIACCALGLTGCGGGDDATTPSPDDGVAHASDDHLTAGELRVELGQVQVLSASSPDQSLVAGRDLLVRVYGDVKAAAVGASGVELAASMPDGSSFTRPLNCPTQLKDTAAPGLRAFYGNGPTCWAAIKAEQVQAGMTLAVRAPEGSLFGAIDWQATPPLRPRATLRLTLVPLTIKGQTATLPSDDEVREAVLRVMPFAAVEVRRHPAWTPEGTFDKNLVGEHACVNNGPPNDWKCALSQLDRLRALAGDPGHYIGLVPLDIAALAGVQRYTAGMGYVGGKSSLVLDQLRRGGTTRAWRESAMHELGHNLGLGHAPCGDPSNPDPYWLATPEPWSKAASAQLDPSPRVVGPNLATASPWTLDGGFASVMSYCNGQWFSSHEGKLMADHIEHDDSYHDAVAMSQVQSVSTDGLWTPPVVGSWLVQAHVAGGQVRYAPIEATALPPLPQRLRAAPWRLRFTLVDGQTVDHEVWPLAIDHDDSGSRDLLVRLPIPPAALTSMTLFDNQGRLVPEKAR